MHEEVNHALSPRREVWRLRCEWSRRRWLVRGAQIAIPTQQGCQREATQPAPGLGEKSPTADRCVSRVVSASRSFPLRCQLATFVRRLTD